MKSMHKPRLPYIILNRQKLSYHVLISVAGFFFILDVQLQFIDSSRLIMSFLNKLQNIDTMCGRSFKRPPGYQNRACYWPEICVKICSKEPMKRESNIRYILIIKVQYRKLGIYSQGSSEGSRNVGGFPGESCAHRSITSEYSIMEWAVVLAQQGQVVLYRGLGCQFLRFLPEPALDTIVVEHTKAFEPTNLLIWPHVLKTNGTLYDIFHVLRYFINQHPVLIGRTSNIIVTLLSNFCLFDAGRNMLLLLGFVRPQYFQIEVANRTSAVVFSLYMNRAASFTPCLWHIFYDDPVFGHFKGPYRGGVG